MAERLGVRTETLASWERGQAKPLARHQGAIVAFLGYDPAPAGATPGARLRELRRRLGLTQEQLAAGLGLDEGTVSEFELGRRRVSRRVQRLIDGFVAVQGES